MVQGVALEEAGAETVGDAVEIDESEEVDRAEFGVDGGWAAEAAGDIEVGAEEARSARERGEFAGLLATRGGVRFGSQCGVDQIFVAKRVVEGHAFVLVLRGEGAAADEIAGIAKSRVGGDAFPEEEEGGGVSVGLVDACAAEFQDFAANVFERCEVEELLAVIAEIAFGAIAGLHAVGAYERASDGIVDHEVIADQVEAVAVEAGGVGVQEAFAELAVEYFVTQALAGDEVVHILRQGKAKERSGLCEAFAVFD